jgi:hypothetical protein
MVLKLWLRMGLLSMFLLAGCVQPTPTPASTQTPDAGGAYPGLVPTLTPVPGNYPAPGSEATPTAGPYPAPTSGAVSHLVPL